MSRRYQQEQRLELLTETALRMGAKWEKATVQLVLEELSQVSDAEFSACLRQAELECTYVPRPVDFISRCPSLKWQSADEAWAAIDGKTEADTVVWTDLAAAAYSEVAQMPDPVAQRMSFKATYARMAEAWKTACRRPKPQVSLGTDPTRRADAVRAAVKAGRLPNHEARRLLPEAAAPVKALPPPREIPQGLVLSEADREYIAWMMRTDTPTPTEAAVMAKLGPYAGDKMRLFLASAPTAKVYQAGCASCGSAVDESETTHCDLCRPEAMRRSLERRAAADLQNKRESDALARMRGATT